MTSEESKLFKELMRQKHAKKDQEEEKKGRRHYDRIEPKEYRPPQIDGPSDLSHISATQSNREQLNDAAFRITKCDHCGYT